MKQPRFQVYEAKDGFRWRLLAANGRTIADSGEAYTTAAGVKRAVAMVTETVERIGHRAMINRIRVDNPATVTRAYACGTSYRGLISDDN